MFNMSDLSTKLWSAEVLYLFPIKDIFLDSVLLYPLDILPRQNWVWKLRF